MSEGSVVKITAGAVLGLVILFVGIESYFTVQPNEVAVLTKYGNIEESYTSGLHWKNPLTESVHTFRTDLQSLPLDKMNTYTIDNQELDATVTVVYQISADQAQRILSDVPDYEARLSSLTIDRFKAAVGKINTTEIAQKRGDVSKTVLATLQVDAMRLFGLKIVDFQINGIDYTDQYRAAVDKAAMAKTQVEVSQQMQNASKVEAETARIAAEGAANAVREKAKGDADAALYAATAEAKAIQIKGEAQATAIKAQSDALSTNPLYVELKKIGSGWNGQLPAAIYAGAPLPILDAK